LNTRGARFSRKSRRSCGAARVTVAIATAEGRNARDAAFPSACHNNRLTGRAFAGAPARLFSTIGVAYLEQPNRAHPSHAGATRKDPSRPWLFNQRFLTKVAASAMLYSSPIIRTQVLRTSLMNLPGQDHSKRRLPILLACVMVLQTVLGIPGLAAGQADEIFIGGAEPLQASANHPDSALAGTVEIVVDDECREPCDLIQCECAFCCQGNQQTVLNDLFLVSVLAARCSPIASPLPSASRMHSTIHRPPIV